MLLAYNLSLSQASVEGWGTGQPDNRALQSCCCCCIQDNEGCVALVESPYTLLVEPQCLAKVRWAVAK